MNEDGLLKIFPLLFDTWDSNKTSNVCCNKNNVKSNKKSNRDLKSYTSFMPRYFPYNRKWDNGVKQRGFNGMPCKFLFRENGLLRSQAATTYLMDNDNNFRHLFLSALQPNLMPLGVNSFNNNIEVNKLSCKLNKASGITDLKNNCINSMYTFSPLTKRVWSSNLNYNFPLNSCNTAIISHLPLNMASFINMYNDANENYRKVLVYRSENMVKDHPPGNNNITSKIISALHKVNYNSTNYPVMYPQVFLYSPYKGFASNENICCKTKSKFPVSQINYKNLDTILKSVKLQTKMQLSAKKFPDFDYTKTQIPFTLNFLNNNCNNFVKTTRSSWGKPDVGVNNIVTKTINDVKHSMINVLNLFETQTNFTDPSIDGQEILSKLQNLCSINTSSTNTASIALKNILPGYSSNITVCSGQINNSLKSPYKFRTMDLSLASDVNFRPDEQPTPLARILVIHSNGTNDMRTNLTGNSLTENGTFSTDSLLKKIWGVATSSINGELSSVQSSTTPQNQSLFITKPANPMALLKQSSYMNLNFSELTRLLKKVLLANLNVTTHSTMQSIFTQTEEFSTRSSLITPKINKVLFSVDKSQLSLPLGLTESQRLSKSVTPSNATALSTSSQPSFVSSHQSQSLGSMAALLKMCFENTTASMLKLFVSETPPVLMLPVTQRQPESLNETNTISSSTRSNSVQTVETPVQNLSQILTSKSFNLSALPNLLINLESLKNANVNNNSLFFRYNKYLVINGNVKSEELSVTPILNKTRLVMSKKSKGMFKMLQSPKKKEVQKKNSTFYSNCTFGQVVNNVKFITESYEDCEEAYGEDVTKINSSGIAKIFGKIKNIFIGSENKQQSLGNEYKSHAGSDYVDTTAVEVISFNDGKVTGISKSSCEVTETSKSSCEVTGMSKSSCEVTETSKSSCEVTGMSKSSCEVTGTSKSSCEVIGTSKSSCEVTGTSRSSCETSSVLNYLDFVNINNVESLPVKIDDTLWPVIFNILKDEKYNVSSIGNATNSTIDDNIFKLISNPNSSKIATTSMETVRSSINNFTTDKHAMNNASILSSQNYTKNTSYSIYGPTISAVNICSTNRTVSADKVVSSAVKGTTNNSTLDYSCCTTIRATSPYTVSNHANGTLVFNVVKKKNVHDTCGNRQHVQNRLCTTRNENCECGITKQNYCKHIHTAEITTESTTPICIAECGVTQLPPVTNPVHATNTISTDIVTSTSEGTLTDEVTDVEKLRWIIKLLYGNESFINMFDALSHNNSTNATGASTIKLPVVVNRNINYTVINNNLSPNDIVNVLTTNDTNMYKFYDQIINSVMQYQTKFASPVLKNDSLPYNATDVKILTKQPSELLAQQMTSNVSQTNTMYFSDSYTVQAKQNTIINVTVLPQLQSVRQLMLTYRNPFRDVTQPILVTRLPDLLQQTQNIFLQTLTLPNRITIRLNKNQINPLIYPIDVPYMYTQLHSPSSMDTLSKGTCNEAMQSVNSEAIPPVRNDLSSNSIVSNKPYDRGLPATFLNRNNNLNSKYNLTELLEKSVKMLGGTNPKMPFNKVLWPASNLGTKDDKNNNINNKTKMYLLSLNESGIDNVIQSLIRGTEKYNSTTLTYVYTTPKSNVNNINVEVIAEQNRLLKEIIQEIIKINALDLSTRRSRSYRQLHHALNDFKINQNYYRCKTNDGADLSCTLKPEVLTVYHDGYKINKNQLPEFIATDRTTTNYKSIKNQSVVNDVSQIKQKEIIQFLNSFKSNLVPSFLLEKSKDINMQQLLLDYCKHLKNDNFVKPLNERFCRSKKRNKSFTVHNDCKNKSNVIIHYKTKRSDFCKYGKKNKIFKII